MLVESLAKKTMGFKSFVVDKVYWRGDGLIIELIPRKRSRPVCVICGKKRSCYDTLNPREWRHVKLWGIETFIIYSPRRVKCPSCGIRVERMPWSMGKDRLSLPLVLVLQTLARHISWEGVTQLYGVSWNTVRAAVKSAVDYGLANRHLNGIIYIGVDELSSRKGHRYVTNVYDLAENRLLATAPGRDEISLAQESGETVACLGRHSYVLCNYRHR